MNPAKICRLCLDKCEQVLNLLEESEETQIIRQQILLLLRVDISSNDGLPHFTCQTCVQKVNDCYQFYAKVQDNQELLLSKTIKIELREESDPEQDDFQAASSPVESDFVPKSDPDSSSDEDDKPLNRRRRPQRKATVARKEKPSSTRPRKSQRAAEDLKLNIKLKEFYNFTCTTCDPPSTFDQYIELFRHRKTAHGEARPVIICCGKRFTKRARLVTHMTWHLNPDEFKCPACGLQSVSKYCLDIHIRTKHASDETKRYECPNCPKRFSTSGYLKAHSLTHLTKEARDELRTHQCPECPKSFISKAIVDHHVRQAHAMAYRSVCDICAKIFLNKADFQYHYEMQHGRSDEQRRQCDVCQSWLTNERQLKRHMSRVHSGEGPVACNECGKISPNLGALKSHQLYVHGGKRKYECSFCQKAFRKPVELKEHMTTHVGGVLYTCPYCTKSFNSNANMHSHKKKAHPEEWAANRVKRMTGVE